MQHTRVHAPWFVESDHGGAHFAAEPLARVFAPHKWQHRPDAAKKVIWLAVVVGQKVQPRAFAHIGQRDHVPFGGAKLHVFDEHTAIVVGAAQAVHRPSERVAQAYLGVAVLAFGHKADGAVKPPRQAGLGSFV